jgi:uncharacterized membrane protein
MAEISESNTYYRELGTHLITICTAIVAFPGFFISNGRLNLSETLESWIILMVIFACISIIAGIIQIWIDQGYHRRKARAEETIARSLRGGEYKTQGEYVQGARSIYKQQEVDTNSDEKARAMQLFSGGLAIILLAGVGINLILMSGKVDSHMGNDNVLYESESCSDSGLYMQS